MEQQKQYEGLIFIECLLCAKYNGPNSEHYSSIY